MKRRRWAPPKWVRYGKARAGVGAGLLALLVATVFTSGALLTHAYTTGQGQGQSRSVLHGHLVPALRGAKPLHATAGAQALSLDIALAPRNQAQLSQLIAAQNDRQSPLYHHYLTPEQYTQEFGPTQATVDAVTQYLRGQGLVVVGSVSSNRLILHASGSVSSVEQAFATQLSDFALGSRVVYAPTVEPSVPASLAGSIVSIVGLDNTVQFHSHTVRPASRPTKPHSGTGPGGGYTPSELRTAYDMNSLISSADGTGQTIAIYELDSYDATDVNTYLSNYSLGSAKYSNVIVDGASTTPGVGAIEVELDMEVVSAIAPGANQLIYIAPNDNAGQGPLDNYNKIVTDDKAAVTSTSWGLCEALQGNSYLQAEDNIFQQGAAQGQAFFAAAGDTGAYDCRDGTTINVDNPADDPNVVGVGGTTLNTGTGGSYGSETVWNDTSGAGGGGLSTYFRMPSYQSGPGVQNKYSNGFREVPDVSADADLNTGYSEYCTAGSDCNGAGWIEVGGTSAAAPLWAAVATDANEYLAANGIPTLGTASADLYGLFNLPQTHSPYHDITSGNNLHYPATTGYDLASGIGTPDVWNLVRDIRPRIATVEGYVATATAPNTTAPSQKFTLKNTGVGPLTYSIGSLPAWVASVSPTSGTIATGGFQPITVNYAVAPSSPQTLDGTLTITDPSASNSGYTLPLTEVVASLSKTWYFAEGYTGGSFTEYLTLANPGSTAANVSVKYLLGGGQAPITKPYVVSATSRRTLTINTEAGGNKNVSLVVTSDQPIVAERPMYFTYTGLSGYTIPGGSDVLGATSLGTSYDFGYLDTTAGHATYLTILNQNSTAMTVTTTYYTESTGAATKTTHTVPGNSRGTINVNSEAGLPAGPYSATVSLSEPGLVERPLYLRDSGTGDTGSADVIGVSQPLTSWAFAEGYTGSTFSERYILSNLSTTTTAHATVTFFKDDGSSVQQAVALPPGTQRLVDANQALGTGVDNSATVTSDLPILAERFMSFKYTGPVGPPGTSNPGIPGASDVLGASAPSRLFDFAEGYTGGKFAEYLTIVNPNSQPVTVQVTFLPQTSGSTPFVRHFTIGATTRFGFYINAAMVNQSFSMQVISTAPVVAERPMYFDYTGGQTGGTDIVGYQP